MNDNEPNTSGSTVRRPRWNKKKVSRAETAAATRPCMVYSHEVADG